MVLMPPVHSSIDIYITPTKKEASMFDEIEKVIRSQESCTMRLIHKSDIMFAPSLVFDRIIPERLFSQIVIVDDKTKYTVGRSITGDCNVIQTVSKWGFVFSFMAE